MVQSKTLEKYIDKSPEIAQEAGTNPETARRVMKALQDKINSNRRQPKEPAPPGSISLRAASRKHGIAISVLSYWCKNNYVKVLKRTKNWLYIDEESIITYKNKKETSVQPAKNCTA